MYKKKLQRVHPASCSSPKQSEESSIIPNDDDLAFVPSLAELDDILKHHRAQRKKKYLDLTQCGPCCPCYNCINPSRQGKDSLWPEEEEEATDNFALLFGHLYRGRKRKLPDRPILVDVPKFVKDFREALTEARQQNLRNAYLDLQLKFFQTMRSILMKILYFLVMLLLWPFIQNNCKSKTNNNDNAVSSSDSEINI